MSLSTTKNALKYGVPATLFVLVIAEVVAAFETTMALQLLYTPGEFFTKDLAALSWIVTSYSLCAALATSFVGRLGDQFGRRNILLLVLAISLVGSAISAMAPTFGVLIAGRALQGVSGAVLPLCIGIVRASFPQGKVALGVAVVSTSALIAGAGGSLVGGVMLDFATWPWIFWSAVILAGVTIVLVRLMINADPASTLSGAQKIDWLGGILFGGGIAAALFGFTKAKDLGWGDPQVALPLAGALLALIGWFFWERRVSEPMLDLNLFKNKKFSLGMAATALIAVGPIGMTNILSITLYRTPNSVPGPDGTMIDLPVGLGMSATMAGVLACVTAAASFATAPLIGKVSAKAGARMALMIGAILTIVGLGIVCIAPATFWVAFPGLVVGVLGTGFLYSGMPTVLVECVGASDTSTATGMGVVLRTTFQAVAASVVTVFLVTAPVVVGGTTFTSTTGLYLVAGACALTCVLTILIVSRIPAPSVTTQQQDTGVLVKENS